MSNTLYDHLLAPHADNQAPFLKRDDHPPISYAQFVASTAQLAHVLSNAGLKPGDRVVAQADKSVQMVMLYAATFQAGGVFLPLNTAYQRDEVAYFVEDAKPKLVICDPAKSDSLADIAQAHGAQILTLDGQGQGIRLTHARQVLDGDLRKACAKRDRTRQARSE
ncbi:MAG: AMP-binding protein [Pseudomonadota bacterium]